LIAALYVETNGVYSGLPNVDLWDEARDARLYDGPWPVVAHPPCARWSRLAGFTEYRFGLKRGDDGGCFEAALAAVRRFGGVLEHPAFSKAWDQFGLAEPIWRGGWNLGLDGGASAYVEQGRYGLPVKKATWLYAYGCELPELRWGYTSDGDGDDIGGMDAWRDRFGGRRAAWEESLGSTYNEDGVRCRPSHLGQHSTTPPEFRDVLIAMARTAPAPVRVSSIGYISRAEYDEAAREFDDEILPLIRRAANSQTNSPAGAVERERSASGELGTGASPLRDTRPRHPGSDA
jgi:hypothetical protein